MMPSNRPNGTGDRAQVGPAGTFRQVVGSNRLAVFSSLVQTIDVCLCRRPTGRRTDDRPRQRWTWRARFA
jgi:hypothetical protein